MTATLAGYPDLLGGTSESHMPKRDMELQKKLKKAKKQVSRLKQHIADMRAKRAEEQQLAEAHRLAEEQRIAEEQRAAEKKRAEEEKKKEDDSLITKIKDALIKAIPMAIVAVAKFFAKKWFSLKNK